jgi:hypothetical protein
MPCEDHLSLAERPEDPGLSNHISAISVGVETVIQASTQDLEAGLVLDVIGQAEIACVSRSEMLGI